MNSRVTVKDLARICGVSIGTVDRAINGRGGINPETKEKILAAAREYGFVKNQNAISLSRGKPNLLGVIMPNLKTEFLATLLSAIEEEATALGFSTIIMLSGYSVERERDCATRMRSMDIAGLIVFPVISDAEFYRSVMRMGIPVVTVGNRIEGIPFVGIDDRLAMERATEFVISRGYERLIYVAPLLEKAGRENLSAQVLRHEGFLAASDEVRREVIADRRAYGELLGSLESGEFFGDTRTALICPSDSYTIDCLPYIGKRCGIIGFDRLPMIGRLIPELAGVVYPTAGIGKAAALLTLNPENSSGIAAETIFEFSIVEGETI